MIYLSLVLETTELIVTRPPRQSKPSVTEDDDEVPTEEGIFNNSFLEEYLRKEDEKNCGPALFTSFNAVGCPEELQTFQPALKLANSSISNAPSSRSASNVRIPANTMVEIPTPSSANQETFDAPRLGHDMPADSPRPGHAMPPAAIFKATPPCVGVSTSTTAVRTGGSVLKRPPPSREPDELDDEGEGITDSNKARRSGAGSLSIDGSCDGNARAVRPVTTIEQFLLRPITSSSSSSSSSSRLNEVIAVVDDDTTAAAPSARPNDDDDEDVTGASGDDDEDVGGAFHNGRAGRGGRGTAGRGGRGAAGRGGRGAAGRGGGAAKASNKRSRGGR